MVCVCVVCVCVGMCGVCVCGVCGRVCVYVVACASVIRDTSADMVRSTTPATPKFRECLGGNEKFC